MYMTRTKGTNLHEKLFGRGLVAKDKKFYSQHRFPFRTNFHAISSLFPMISTASQGKFVFSILHHRFNILIQKKSCCPKTKTNSKCYI